MSSSFVTTGVIIAALLWERRMAGPSPPKSFRDGGMAMPELVPFVCEPCIKLTVASSLCMLVFELAVRTLITVAAFDIDAEELVCELDAKLLMVAVPFVVLFGKQFDSKRKKGMYTKHPALSFSSKSWRTREGWAFALMPFATIDKAFSLLLSLASRAAHSAYKRACSSPIF